MLVWGLQDDVRRAELIRLRLDRITEPLLSRLESLRSGGAMRPYCIFWSLDYGWQ